jgi:hypothetical protein
MLAIPEQEAIQQIADLLGDWLRAFKDDVGVRKDFNQKGIDARIDVGDHKFIIESKASSNAAQVNSAIQTFKKHEVSFEGYTIPLLAVPFMGDVGRKLCKEANISWLDLSGNANIFAPGLRILIEGRPNRFKSIGRPSNPFAPKSSRIARWLLIHADQLMSQREIVQATDMDEGFTSRIISRLEKEGLIAKSKEGLIRVLDPDLLLDSWRERYSFSKHQIIKGHVAARSSDELLEKVTNLLLKKKVPHAATGLGAAWLYTRFSGFRIVTLYLKFRPPDEILNLLGFREEPRGANVWLVFPKDGGVFQGSEEVEGLRCVHPVQVYLDLFGHPERAKEAAVFLRQELLKWNKDA